MTRTCRRKKHDGGSEKGERDGRGGIFGRSLPPRDFIVEVVRRDRRKREDEAGKLERGVIDPDDTPTKPRPKKLWQWWKRW